MANIREVIKTPRFIAVYPSLDKPRTAANPATGKAYANATAKYGLTLAFSAENFTAIQDVISKVVREKWGEDAVKSRVITDSDGNPTALKFPVERADTFNKKRADKGKAPFADLAGHFLVRTSSANQPTACDGNLNELEPGQIRGGDICRAEICVSTMEGELYTGVVIYLNMLQRIKKGAASRVAADVFSRESADDTAPDDEIPF